MKRLRLPLLLLTILLAGCVCAPATVSLTGAPSDEEVAQARRAFGFSEAQTEPDDQSR